jgi:hypothetical protein
MKSWTYFPSNVSFEHPVDGGYETFEADVKVYACKDIYGEDADGNRGITIVKRYAEILGVRDSSGKSVLITDQMRESIQDIVNERGAELE